MAGVSAAADGQVHRRGRTIAALADSVAASKAASLSKKKRWAHSNAGLDERLRVFAAGREVLPFTAELRDARVVRWSSVVRASHAPLPPFTT